MTLSRREFVAATAAGTILIADWVHSAPLDGPCPKAFAAIDAMVARYMREMNAPGLTLAIADRNDVLRVATYGMSDADRKEPVRSDHRSEPTADSAREAPADRRHTSGFPPGAYFHYSNLGYGILGLLIETLEGRPYPDVIRARIFKPLGMNASAPAISPDLRERTVASYVSYLDDRPYTRYGRLAHAPQIVIDDAAGSIASTAADMGLYIRMLARRGSPLLKENAFSDMSKRHIRLADEGEPGYGYGLFTDTLDDHQIIRHTGGMVSFMSAMHVDLNDGIAAFASVNAQQGYRPNPVTTYAIRAIRAANANKPMPDPPTPNLPATIKNASDLAGVYTSADGAKIEREQKDGGRAISVGHGARWWTSEHYSGPRTFDVPDAWRAFEGHYRNEDPWTGSGRIVLRQGKLWVNGTAALRPVDANTFRFADPEYNPEWVQFLDVVNGKARHVKVSGTDLWRVEVR